MADHPILEKTIAARPAFWDWATQAYARNAAAKHLILLQDRHGFNVNLLLWNCWIASSFISPSADEMGAAVGTVAEWHNGVTCSIRTARHAVRPFETSADADAITIGKRLRALELEAEKYEIERLEKFATQTLSSCHIDNRLTEISTAQKNLNTYCDVFFDARGDKPSPAVFQQVIADIFEVPCGRPAGEQENPSS